MFKISIKWDSIDYHLPILQEYDFDDFLDEIICFDGIEDEILRFNICLYLYLIAQNRDYIFDDEKTLFEFIHKIKDNYFKIRN